jgi:hypothetical protein
MRTSRVGAEDEPQDVDAKLRDVDAKLRGLHKEFRSMARQIMRNSKVRSPGADALVAIVKDSRSPEPVVLKTGNLNDLMTEIVSVRRNNPRQSPYVYVGIFEINMRSRAPRVLVDMMDTGQEWQVYEGETEG